MIRGAAAKLAPSMIEHDLGAGPVLADGAAEVDGAVAARAHGRCNVGHIDGGEGGGAESAVVRYAEGHQDGQADDYEQQAQHDGTLRVL